MKRLRTKLAYQTFSIGLKLARATGLIEPLRKSVGPLVGRIVSRASGDQEQPVIVNGHRMILGTRGTYPPINMAADRYEIETTRLFKHLLKPGMKVVDVGAHVGYYSLLAASLVGPEGRVYAFEPEPRNFELLLRNVELNGYQNIVPVNEAFSNQSGMGTLFLTALDSGRHSMYPNDLPDSGSLRIKTTTADSFLEAQGWPQINLIKIDVEGAELDVLSGMSRLLHTSSSLNLILEFNPILLKNAGIDPFRFLKNPFHLVSNSSQFHVYCIDENNGHLDLDKIGTKQLVESLLAKQGSVNLHYTKQ